MGTIAAYFWGEILPDDEDTAALKSSNTWRLIYFYFPFVLYLITILGLLFVVRQDSVKFLMGKGKKVEAKAHIKQLYKDAKSEEAIE